jgi:hypothetical protein
VFKVLGSGGEHGLLIDGRVRARNVLTVVVIGKARQQQYELVIQREKEERMWRREGW